MPEGRHSTSPATVNRPRFLTSLHDGLHCIPSSLDAFPRVQHFSTFRAAMGAEQNTQNALVISDKPVFARAFRHSSNMHLADPKILSSTLRRGGPWPRFHAGPPTPSRLCFCPFSDDSFGAADPAQVFVERGARLLLLAYELVSLAQLRSHLRGGTGRASAHTPMPSEDTPRVAHVQPQDRSQHEHNQRLPIWRSVRCWQAEIPRARACWRAAS